MNRRDTKPEPIVTVSSTGAATGARPQPTASPPLEPIEATLEPPEDDDVTRPAMRTIDPRDVQKNGEPRRNTVIINVGAADEKKQRDDGQYLMVRPERMAPSFLLVCMGANVGHRYAIVDNELTIGRSDKSDIRLDDDRVSSRHCELVRRGGRYRIYDLGSSNGTLVNAQRVDEIDLRDGDLIQVGYTVFRYQSADALEPFARPQPPAALPPPDPAQNAIVAQPVAAPPAVAPALGGGVDAGVATRVHRRRDDDEDDEVSFAEMVAQLRRIAAFFWPYRVLIAALAVGGAIGGAVSAVLFPPLVASYFEVRLQSKASNNPLDKFESSNVQFFASAATNFKSSALIERTLEALGEPPDPSVDNSARVAFIQDHLAFINTGGGQGTDATYRGSYTGPTPERSQLFLTRHVEIFLDSEIDKTLKIIKAQVDFLQGQLATTETDLRATETKLLDFKKKNIDGLPDQARQYYDYLFELQKKASDTSTEIARLEAESAVDARRVETESPLVQSRVLAVRPYQQAIVDVNRQLAEAKASGLGDDHPDVKQLKAKLEELKRLAAKAEESTDSTEIEQQRNAIYDSSLDRLQRLRAQAAATRQEQERLKQDFERIRGIVEKLPQLEAQYAELTRSYDATKQLHGRLFDQVKTTELQYELEKASAKARYEIITAPRLEYVSKSKHLMKRTGLAAVVGVALGLALAALLQARRLLAVAR